MSIKSSTVEQWEYADKVLDYLSDIQKISPAEKKHIKARLTSLINDYYEFETTLEKLRELANL